MRETICYNRISRLYFSRNGDAFSLKTELLLTLRGFDHGKSLEYGQVVFTIIFETILTRDFEFRGARPSVTWG